jgi:predicted MFS family arabinose efflux permease
VSDTALPSAPIVVPRRTIVLLSAAAFASAANLRICDPLLPQVAHDYATTPGRASIIVTAFAVAYGLLQLVWGPIGDRSGKYRVAALASIGAGVFTVAGTLTTTLGGVGLARFLSGAAAAAIIPLAFAWIGDGFPFERRQAVLARFLSAQFTGIVLGQALGGYLGEIFGWRSAFLVIGTIHVVAGVAMLVELTANPGAQPKAPAALSGFRSSVTTTLDVLRVRWVQVMLLTVFVEAFAMYGAFAYIGADMHNRFGLSFGLIGLVLCVYGAGALAYSLTARILVSRLGERGLVTAGGFVIGACYLVLAAAPAVIIAAPAIAALGFGFYMLHNTLQTNATQMAPKTRAIGVSLFAFFLFLGQSIGVALAAPMIDRWGAPPVYLVAAVMVPLIALWFRARLRYRPPSAS